MCLLQVLDKKEVTEPEEHVLHPSHDRVEQLMNDVRLLQEKTRKYKDNARICRVRVGVNCGCNYVNKLLRLS